MASTLTNFGAQWVLSMAFRRCDPAESTVGNTGCDLNGSSDPAEWYILLLNTYFQAGGNPNPDHGTLADLTASVSGCVVDIAYSVSGTYDKPLLPAEWVATLDDANNRGKIAVATGTELEIEIQTQALSNVGGVAVCQKNSIAGTNKVLKIVQFTAVQTLAIGDKLRITTNDGYVVN